MPVWASGGKPGSPKPTELSEPSLRFTQNRFPMIKKISLTPAIFHLPEAVNRIAADYCRNPMMPRGIDFPPLLSRLRKKLADSLDVAETHSPVLFLSSGSGAIAAAMGCCVDKDGILIVSNGPYGERMANFSRTYGNQTFHYELEYGQRPETEQIESLIRIHKPSSVGIVHGATGSCSLNPVEEIAGVVKRYGLKLYVDCISSAFVEEIDVRGWGIDVLIGSSNKGLHSTPGIGFVLIDNDFLDEIVRFHPNTPFFNVVENHEKQKKGQFPFTIDPRLLLEMEAALDEFFDRGGLEGRMKTYRERNGYLRKEFERLGLEFFQKDGMPLQNIGTALMIPPYADYGTLAYELENFAEHGESYVIYSAQSKLSGSVFRVFNMGEYEMQSYVNFIDALEKTLEKLKRKA